MKAMTKTTDLGKGWKADQFTDTSMHVRNDVSRVLIDLSPASVATLKLAMKGKAA